MIKNISRKLFYLLAIIFFITLALIAYDFARKTTIPGSKIPDKELKNADMEKMDSTKIETEK